MTLIRLVSVSTDLVITINLPHILAEEDTNAGPAVSGASLDVGSHEEVDFESGRFGSFVEDGMKVRDEVLRTLTIHDWTLFGEDEDPEVDGMRE